MTWYVVEGLGRPWWVLAESQEDAEAYLAWTLERVKPYEPWQAPDWAQVRYERERLRLAASATDGPPSAAADRIPGRD
jgi:hypothetical protein